MQDVRRPRPFLEYQSHFASCRREGDKWRGLIECAYNDGSMDESEGFEFTCDVLRDSQDEAINDARARFQLLATTSPPNVAFSGQVYSLPTLDEKARAEQWLAKNPHAALEFIKEFPGARLIAAPLLGARAIRD